MEKGCLVAFKPNTMGAMESNIMLFLEENIKIYIHIVCISGYVCVCVCVCVCMSALLITYSEPCLIHDLLKIFSFGTRDQACSLRDSVWQKYSKVNKDKESLWHKHQKGNREYPPC